MNIYVGNLSYDVTDESLREAFGAYGEVSSANVIKDKYSGKSKGFGFVEMKDDTKAQAAIDGLNAKDLMGRALKVSQAKPRTENRDRGGFGGDRGGGNRRW